VAEDEFLDAFLTKFYKICQLVLNIDIVDLDWGGGQERRIRLERFEGENVRT